MKKGLVNMEYAKLGNTDIEVSKLCVGCMSFGKPGTMHDWTLDETRTEEIVKHALDLGINFFDTANGYSDGTSEEYLGNALRKNVARDKVVIASKVYFNPGRLSSEAIHREIEGSLKRLGTDYLDLYIIHRFDYDTPIEETMEALNDLVVSGKVRAIGASAMYGYQFYNMQLAARDNGWTAFSSMLNHDNPLYREDERELIPVCRQMNVALTPYSPLAAGRCARPNWEADTLRSRTDKVARSKYDSTEEADKSIAARIAALPSRLPLLDMDVTLSRTLCRVEIQGQTWEQALTLSEAEKQPLTFEGLQKLNPLDMLKRAYESKYHTELPEDLETLFTDVMREAYENRSN